MTPDISVILCTHNPRRDYLRRTLEGLGRVTLPRERWEFLLVDNASNPGLAGEIGLEWHPQARHCREDRVGLSHARLRGIAEARGRILVWVDDDNVLRPDYLDTALRMAAEHPDLGVWSGGVLPEFEVPPPEWTRPYWGCLTLREVTSPIWYVDEASASHAVQPSGAGMCIRAEIARRYADLCASDPARLALGRRGLGLGGAEDADMALTAFGMGFKTAILPDLQLLHLIPARRLELDYLCRLVEGGMYSSFLLWHLRGYPLPARSGWFRGMLAWIRAWGHPRPERLLRMAARRGIQRAVREFGGG